MEANINSPCDSKCGLNEINYCTSCFRSVHEICTWKTMEKEDKSRIMGEIIAIKLSLIDVNAVIAE